MTWKAQRKAIKRNHIQAAVKVQNEWIERAFSLEAGTRRERDALFHAARQIQRGI